MSRWARFFSHRERMMEDLDQEIRDHFARETEDNIKRGMSPGEGAHIGVHVCDPSRELRAVHVTQTMDEMSVSAVGVQHWNAPSSTIPQFNSPDSGFSICRKSQRQNETEYSRQNGNRHQKSHEHQNPSQDHQSHFAGVQFMGGFGSSFGRMGYQIRFGGFEWGRQMRLQPLHVEPLLVVERHAVEAWVRTR